MEYPVWLKEIFTLMSVLYGTLWTDQMKDEEVAKATKGVWYFYLKDFAVEIIRAGMIEAGKLYQYPPKPSQVIEIMKGLERRERDRLKFEERAMRLPRSQKTGGVDAPHVLEAKRAMWIRLKRFDKVREIDETISAMDLQKK